MNSDLLRELQSINTFVNAQINKHAWVSWLFIYVAEFVFFSSYRLSNITELVKISATPDEDSTSIRVYGVLLGIVEDFVVASFLILILWGFDAVINSTACCNDTAPNGFLDCCTRGIPFRSWTKLVFKRFLRFTFIYAMCLLSVTLFAFDVVFVRSYHHRYELGRDSNSDQPDKKNIRTINQVLMVVLSTQGTIAVLTTIWFDFTRWTPITCAKQWGISWQNHGLPTIDASQASVNYFALEHDSYFFFNFRDNEIRSESSDSSNIPIRGTQRPLPCAVLSDGRCELPAPLWKLEAHVVGSALVIFVFLVIPLLVLLVTSYCSPAIASIAINPNLNEPLRVLTTLSFD